MRNRRGGPQLSYAKLAGLSIGAATLVLVFTTVLLSVLRPSPGIGLTIALLGVAGAIVAMGVVATRIANEAFAEPESDLPDETDPPVTQ